MKKNKPPKGFFVKRHERQYTENAGQTSSQKKMKQDSTNKTSINDDALTIKK